MIYESKEKQTVKYIKDDFNYKQIRNRKMMTK